MAAEELKLLQQLREDPELLKAIRDSTAGELRLQEELRRTWPADLVRAAIGLEEVRRKAARVLPSAEDLWLTPASLQQTTPWEVAANKAKRFPVGEHVHDACCGAGVDTFALLQRGPVTSSDIDEAALQRCVWNVEAWSAGTGSSDFAWKSILQNSQDLNVKDSLIHVDPDRRVGRDRAAKRLEQYCPDLNWMQNLCREGLGGVIKIGPASNFMQKFPGCEIELVSLRGECKEARVWFGQLAGPQQFRATVLPSGESVSADPLQAWCPVVSECEQYIFDPDPAVVRSGLLDVIGEMHSLRRLDSSDEYLTSGDIPNTSLVNAFLVEACLPNNLREVKKHLNLDPCVDYEVKCRHVKIDATGIARKLPRGDRSKRTVFFVRIGGKTRVVIAERVDVSRRERISDL